MNPPKKNTGSNSFNEIATLRIELQDTDPVIWRQVEVPTSVTLKVLHDIIPAVMGWFNYHLWEFTIGKQRYGLHSVPRSRNGPGRRLDSRRTARPVPSGSLRRAVSLRRLTFAPARKFRDAASRAEFFRSRCHAAFRSAALFRLLSVLRQRLSSSCLTPRASAGARAQNIARAPGRERERVARRGGWFGSLAGCWKFKVGCRKFTDRRAVRPFF
jgi:Plasmid pRiA4b ORF-3-like protein